MSFYMSRHRRCDDVGPCRIQVHRVRAGPVAGPVTVSLRARPFRRNIREAQA